MLSRTDVVGFRAAAHGLVGAGADRNDAVPRLLRAGIQDHPTGVTARLTLRLRGQRDVDAVLVHSVRAAAHLHGTSDLGLLASALRPDDGADLVPSSIGPFGAELGTDFGAAVDEVAGVMADVMADGQLRTKGELSGAVTPRVSERLTPWCGTCAVHHVQDALFRYATLQAGLTIDTTDRKAHRFTGPHEYERRDADAARAELVRAYFHLAGPVKPANLTSWLALSPTAGKRWWSLVADELEEVDVEGSRMWVHRDDLDALHDPPHPDPTRLLGPFDPLTEICDREFLLPDPSRRRRVWAASANPGIVIVDGEIVATWRRRASGKTLTVTVSPFDALPPSWQRDVRDDLDVVGEFFGAREVRAQAD